MSVPGAARSCPGWPVLVGSSCRVERRPVLAGRPGSHLQRLRQVDRLAKLLDPGARPRGTGSRRRCTRPAASRLRYRARSGRSTRPGASPPSWPRGPDCDSPVREPCDRTDMERHVVTTGVAADVAPPATRSDVHLRDGGQRAVGAPPARNALRIAPLRAATGRACHDTMGGSPRWCVTVLRGEDGDRA